MSPTTLFGLLQGIPLIIAGVVLILKGQQEAGTALIVAGLGAIGLGKKAEDAK